jgi:hypothetical protein
MIAGGVDIDGQRPELLDDAFSDPESSGSVLDIDDAEVDLLAVDDRVELLEQRPSSRLPDHVSDVKNSYHLLSDAETRGRGDAEKTISASRVPASPRPVTLRNRPRESRG